LPHFVEMLTHCVSRKLRDGQNPLPVNPRWRMAPKF